MNQTRRASTIHHGGATIATAVSALAPVVSRPRRLLRFDAVRERTGLSRSTIWRLEQRGSFPQHRRLSLNAVGWLEEEIDTWIASRSR